MKKFLFPIADDQPSQPSSSKQTSSQNWLQIDTTFKKEASEKHKKSTLFPIQDTTSKSSTSSDTNWLTIGTSFNQHSSSVGETNDSASQKKSKKKKREKRDDVEEKTKLIDYEKKRFKLDPHSGANTTIASTPRTLWSTSSTVLNTSNEFVIDTKGDADNLLFQSIFSKDVPFYKRDFFKTMEEKTVGKEDRYFERKLFEKECFEKMEMESLDEFLLRKNRQFVSQTSSQPLQVQHWLDYVHFQDEYASLAKLPPIAVAEKKIAILEKALTHHPSHTVLLFLFFSNQQIVNEDVHYLQQLFKTILLQRNQSIELIWFYISFLKKHFLTHFSISILQVEYSLLLQFAQPKDKLQILIDWCIVLYHSGYIEKSIAMIQAQLEYYFMQIKSIDLLQEFWISEKYRIGEEVSTTNIDVNKEFKNWLQQEEYLQQSAETNLIIYKPLLHASLIEQFPHCFCLFDMDIEPMLITTELDCKVLLCFFLFQLGFPYLLTSYSWNHWLVQTCFHHFSTNTVQHYNYFSSTNPIQWKWLHSTMNILKEKMNQKEWEEIQFVWIQFLMYHQQWDYLSRWSDFYLFLEQYGKCSKNEQEWISFLATVFAKDKQWKIEHLRWIHLWCNKALKSIAAQMDTKQMHWIVTQWSLFQEIQLEELYIQLLHKRVLLEDANCISIMAWYCYIVTESIANACQVFENTLSQVTDDTLQQQVLEEYLQFLFIFQTCSKKHYFDQRMIRQVLHRCLLQFPCHPMFLQWWLEYEYSFTTTTALLQWKQFFTTQLKPIIVKQEQQLPCMLPIAYAVIICFLKNRKDENIEYWLEQALEKESCKQSILLWKVYLSQTEPLAIARNIFYRSVDKIGYAKSLWMMYLRKTDGSKETEAMVQVMLEKQIHIRNFLFDQMLAEQNEHK